jgi:hypothetical protein
VDRLTHVLDRGLVEQRGRHVVGAESALDPALAARSSNSF